MAVTTYTISGDLGDLIGADLAYYGTGTFRPSAISVVVESNVPDDGRSVLVAGAKLHLSDTPVTVNSDGTFSAEGFVASDSDDTNVDPGTPLQYRVRVDYPRSSDGARRTWRSPWFSLTADTDVAEAVEVAYLPASLTSQAIDAVATIQGYAQDGILTAAAGPVLATNLVPDPQAKTTGGSTGSAFTLTRITTGLPDGIAHGLEFTRTSTLTSVIAQGYIGATSNASPLHIPVTPGVVYSFSTKVWTDQSAAKVRLDIRWHSAADAVLSTDTGSLVDIAASTWETRTSLARTAPVDAAYATLMPTFITASGNTVTGAKARITAGMAAEGSTIPNYADGTMTALGWSWTGGAHESASKKVLLATGDYASPGDVEDTAAAQAQAAVAYLGPRPGALAIPVPGWTLPVTVRRTPFGYTADVDYEGLHQRAAGVTVYVDPVNGNNSNDGLTWATAKKDPANASSLGSTYAAAEIVIRGGVYARTECPLFGRPDLIIRAEEGTRPVFTQCDRSTSWTAHSGDAYKVTLSGPGTVFDLTAPLTPGGLPVPLTKVADVPAVVATPHSVFVDGSTHYVHLRDGRAPDTNVLVSRSTYHLNTTSIALDDPHRIYVEGIEFWGGLYARVKAFHPGATFIAKDSAWRFADDNGLGIQGFGTVVNIDCEATHNGVDGFNYHDEIGADPDLTGQVLEVNCVGRLNGQKAGATSCNGTTAHDTYKIVRVGGVHEFNPGPNVADVNDVYAANFGVYAGNALGYAGVDDYDFTAPEGNGKSWFIGCRSTSNLALRDAENAYLSDFQHLGALDGTPNAYA